MFLPEEINKLYDQFSDKVFTAGTLSKKNKELIAAACSVMADCAPCIEWHYREAVKAGATREELSEALAVAMALAAGNKRAKFEPVVNKLELEQ